MKAAFKALQECPPAVVAEVERRLSSGEPPSSVAQYLQSELQLFVAMKPGTLKKNLERYRETTLKTKVMDQVIKAGTGKSADRIIGNINAVEELEKLLGTQLGRLSKIVGHENTLPAGILLTQARDEVRLTKEIAGELAKLQMDTGLIARAPKKITGAVTNPETGEVRAFTWTEEQERIMREVDSMVIDHVADDDA